jgi:hypothetical protein
MQKTSVCSDFYCLPKKLTLMGLRPGLWQQANRWPPVRSIRLDFQERRGARSRSRRALHPSDIFRRGKMYRLCRRTQRRESMLLSGSLPLPSNTGNGEKVLGRAIGGATIHTGQKTIAYAAHRLEKNRLGRIVFNVSAQANHEVVDGAGICVLVHSPDLLQ